MAGIIEVIGKHTENIPLPLFWYEIRVSSSPVFSRSFTIKRLLSHWSDIWSCRLCIMQLFLEQHQNSV